MESWDWRLVWGGDDLGGGRREGTHHEKGGRWWEGGAGSRSQVAACGRREGKDSELGWQLVGGREGKRRKWEAREFKNVFVYFLTLGRSKGKWGWACFTFPMGWAPVWRAHSTLGS